MTTPTKAKSRDRKAIAPQVEITKFVTTIITPNEEDTANTDFYNAQQPKDDTETIMTKLGKGSYFGHKYFVSNRVHHRTARVTALTDMDVAAVYPDEFHKWSHFRNTLILNEKTRVEEEIKVAKQQFDKERKRLSDEMEKLKLNYRKERKELASRLQEVKAEAEKAIHEEYEAEIERQNKEALLKMLVDEAAELEDIEDKLMAGLDLGGNTDSDTSQETSPAKEGIAIEGSTPSTQRQLSLGSALKMKMYKNLYEDVKSDLLADGEIALSQSESRDDVGDNDDISTLEVS